MRETETEQDWHGGEVEEGVGTPTQTPARAEGQTEQRAEAR